MTDTSQQSNNCSGHIGGNASGNTVQTGDHNPAGAHSQHATLPPPERVDMRAELVALREVLTRLESPERRKIANALSDVEDELARPQPDQNEVGEALQRTLDYARKAAGFPRVIAVLQPHVTNAAAWLGEDWHTLADLVGRTDNTRAQIPADRHIQISGDAAGYTVISGNGKVVITQATRLLDPDHPLTPSAIGPNPYQGLAAFTEQEANRFFGREALTRKVWEVFRTLHEPPSQHVSPLRLLSILGPAGCGKSSLARAGLLPELARQPLPGLQQPWVAMLTPGAHPVEALAGVLARLATDGPAAVAKSQEFAETLRTPGMAGAYDGLSRIAAALPGIAPSPLIVLIDQCEELYALCEDAEAQNVFVANLLHAAADRATRVSVILTLRSDFLGHTQRHAALNQAIAAHGVIVPAMDAAALRQAIAEPAARANHPFDTASVDLLLAATVGQAGALPLLQFALTRIWEWLAQGVAPLDTLRHIGGVGGALAGEAQRLYDSLSEADKAIAQRAFVGLVRRGEGMPDTRRRIAVADLMAPGDNPDHVRQVLRLFARPGTRLITLAADMDGTETVELTHEVLFEHWEALQTCLARSRAALRVPPRVDDEVQTAFVPVAVPQERPVTWRQRAVSATLIVLTLAAGGIALLAWQAHKTATQERDRAATARHSAEQERDKARRRFNDVRTLANAFMFDFQDAIEPLAGSTPARLLVVKKALEYLDSLAQEAHDDASLQRDLGVSYSKIGDTLAAVGDTAGALEQYHKGLAIREGLATAEPTNVQAQHQLSISYNKMGDTLAATGDTAGALEQYRNVLAILEALVSAESTHAQVQQHLSVSYNKMGDTLAATGDIAAALEQYRKGLAMREGLATAEPTNAQAQRDLSISYNKVGDTLAVTGDTAGALEQYHKGLAIRERLAKAEPTNAQAQRDVAVSYSKTGIILEAIGDHAGALKHYYTALPIFDALAKAEPTNTQARQDLAQLQKLWEGLKSKARPGK